MRTQLTQSRSKPARSLVTGGAGFLGSHLCERLLAEEHSVDCLDNFLTGTRDNVRHLLEHPRFRLWQHDLIQPLPPEDFSGGFDYVLHLASPASPKDYLLHPMETLQVGSLGTNNALELARRCGSVFLLASTSEVYGDPEVSPQSETYWGHVNPIGPRSVYDEAKRFAEAITMAYHRRYGLPVRIARIFNTYGERMRIEDGRVLPNFMMQALQHKPLTVYGDGSQTRSFCYVSDMVEGLYQLLCSEETGPVNLGNPEEVTILQFSKEVIQLTGSRSEIVFEPIPVDDPRQRKPDISRASASLGWRPQVSRQAGIRQVIPYFQVQLRTLDPPSGP